MTLALLGTLPYRQKYIPNIPGLLAAFFLVVRPPLFGLGRSPITPPGPAMVVIDRKDLNSRNKKKLLGLLAVFFSRWFAHPYLALGGSNYPSWSCNGPNRPEGPKVKKKQISTNPGLLAAFSWWFAHSYWPWEGSIYPPGPANGRNRPKRPKFQKDNDISTTYTPGLLATFLGGSPALCFGIGKGPITPPGPAMVVIDRKDLN